MSEVSWLGFGIASAVTKSFLHFLPSASGVGAPYPVDLKLTVGGVSLPRRSLSIEGARLGHPDGFRLEEAIPALGQFGSGIYLLQVDIAPNQHRIDLTSSSIIVELQYQQSSVRYLPRRVRNANSKEREISKSNNTLSSVTARGIFNPDSDQLTGFAIRDPSLFASIVFLNSSNEAFVARVSSSVKSESVGSIEIPADSVKECDLQDLGLVSPSKLDSTWGSIEVESFSLSFERYLEAQVAHSANSLQNASPIVGTGVTASFMPSQQTATSGTENISISKNETRSFSTEPILGAAVSAYLVYRDRSSRRIASVIAI